MNGVILCLYWKKNVFQIQTLNYVLQYYIGKDGLSPWHISFLFWEMLFNVFMPTQKTFDTFYSIQWYEKVIYQKNVICVVLLCGDWWIIGKLKVENLNTKILILNINEKVLNLITHWIHKFIILQWHKWKNIYDAKKKKKYKKRHQTWFMKSYLNLGCIDFFE